MALSCLLGIASYFFGQPAAIELHWFWMAAVSLCIVALAVVQFIHARNLRRHDDELHAILDAVPHSLFFKDSALRYRVVNAKFEREFDIGRGAAIGKSDRELFGPELEQRFVAQDRALMASGKAGAFDEEIEVHGTLRSIQSRKQPVLDRRGRPRGIVGVAIDVTEQTMLQRQLEDAHDQLSIALEAARMGTWRVDLLTGELHADQRARQILGMKDTDRDVEAGFSRIHPDDSPRLRSRIEEARSDQEAEAYEFRIIDDSGAIRWVEGFASPNRTRGGRHYLIGVNRDITERRLGELALSEAKARADQVLAELEQSQLHLGLALGIGGLGVWRSLTHLPRSASLTGRALLDSVISADAKIREICGHGADTTISYGEVYRLVHPADRTRVVATLRLAYQERGGAYRDQFRIRGRDGVVRTVDVGGSLSTLPAADGETVQVSFTGIAKDITKEEALKTDLITKAEEARSALEGKRQFLAMMSHEVRTPLTGVLGMIDLTLDTVLTDAQRMMLLRSRESSLALLTIINDILDFSKIEARKLELESRPLSLAGLVEDVCATLSPEVVRKGIDLDFTVDPQIPEFILGDSVRLRQVLTNLIGNAVKFTRHGGVKVEVCRDAEGALALSVADTGIGIDAAAAKSIFQPFKQADIATTRRYGGTGLGLTIVKQLVGLMRGSVRCESELGVGTRFVVTLPLVAWEPTVGALLAQRTQDRQTKASSPIGGGRRLLLAEDHQINREVITLQLAKLGFACDCAEDGEEAWERLTAPGAHYALLLTDCHMPRLNGYDLTTRVRAREAEFGLPRLPIVALTANALRGERERCLSLGMDGYLSKPLQLDELRAALAEALDAASNHAPAEPAKVSDAPATPPPAEPVKTYSSLMQLCGGKLDKVAGLIDIFVGATVDDLKAMDNAAEDRDDTRLRQVAHRLSSACHQLDELEAVAALKAVEQAAAPQGLYVAARDEVAAVLARATVFARLHGAPVQKVQNPIESQ